MSSDDPTPVAQQDQKMSDVPLTLSTRDPARKLRQLLNTLGSLLALVLIILGFALAVQIKGGLDQHRFEVLALALSGLAGVRLLVG